jgi:hypothetical protein
MPGTLRLSWFGPLRLSWFGLCVCGTDQWRERCAASGAMAVEVSVGYMSAGWACGRAARGGWDGGDMEIGEGVGWGDMGIGEGVGWEERGLKPNGTATEHREGGGPFGLKSLYISASRSRSRSSQAPAIGNRQPRQSARCLRLSPSRSIAGRRKVGVDRSSARSRSQGSGRAGRHGAHGHRRRRHVRCHGLPGRRSG